MGLFGAAHGWGAKRPPLSKICHTYPKMIKFVSYILPKEDPENINHVTYLLSFADISIFSPEISNFCYIKKFKKYRYRLPFNA